MNIWRDPWVPPSPDRKIITPRGQTILSQVSDLIDPNTANFSYCNKLSLVWMNKPPDMLVSKLVDDVSIILD